MYLVGRLYTGASGSLVIVQDDGKSIDVVDTLERRGFTKRRVRLVVQSEPPAEEVEPSGAGGCDDNK